MKNWDENNEPIYQEICLVITVPWDDYCWNDRCCCGHFDNSEGYAKCTLGLGELKGSYPVKKPESCDNFSVFKGCQR